MTTFQDLCATYLSELRKIRENPLSTAELSLRPALDSFLKEAATLMRRPVEFLGEAKKIAGGNIVEKPKYDVDAQRVYINKTQYFADVPPEVWAFQIGGYQVCQKWLKDRKGRALSFDDLQHYQRVIIALTETMRLMQAVDERIPAWPLA